MHQEDTAQQETLIALIDLGLCVLKLFRALWVIPFLLSTLLSGNESEVKLRIMLVDC